MNLPSIDLEPGLAAALAQVAGDVAAACDRWWVIGSAAMALHGVRSMKPADIDLLMSPDDATRLLQTRGVTPESGTGAGHFRSEVFGSWIAPPLKVEVMAGFRVYSGSTWHDVLPATRIAVATGVGIFHVPAITELIAMCRLFGRPKDEARRRMLEALL